MDIKEAISFTIAAKKKKTLWHKLAKDAKDSFARKYNKLMKENNLKTQIRQNDILTSWIIKLNCQNVHTI